MKLLGLLLFAGLLTGCAAAENSNPIASTQSQPVEVATESPSEATEESEAEFDAEEADTSMLETETEPKESAPATTQSVQPSATKAPPASQDAEPVETQTPEQAPEPEPVESKYSMANIAKNDSTSSCWAAISGKAYDLTAWISRHPGGAGAIVSICGTDATSVFQGRHGGQSGPASSLSAYLLGDVDS
jgi:cytochrome b involved in lipid metabolism